MLEIARAMQNFAEPTLTTQHRLIRRTAAARGRLARTSFEPRSANRGTARGIGG
jgi:hypothetical protein